MTMHMNYLQRHFTYCTFATLPTIKRQPVIIVFNDIDFAEENKKLKKKMRLFPRRCIKIKKPPCGNREVNNAIFSCPKVVQMQFATSGKYVNTPNKWGDTSL